MDTQPQASPADFGTDIETYSGEINDVAQGVRSFYFKRHPIHTFFVFVIPTLISATILYLEIAKTTIFSGGNDIRGPLLLVALPLIVPGISYWRVHSKMKSLFYTELAKSIGFTYSPYGDSPVGTRLSSFGDRDSFTNILSGTFENTRIRLGDYCYTIGSGKNQRSYYYVLGEFSLNAPLPQIVCIPNGWHSVLLDKWKDSGDVPLSLEGDFNTTFTVYVPKGKEMEALQVLEPDVMTKLMQDFGEFGFECNRTSVYLFSTGSIAENRDSVLNMLSFLERFCEVLLPELTKFQSRQPQPNIASSLT
jgi:hypothetical protein